MNDESLEEHGDKVRLTIATMVIYKGKSKEEVKRDFGEPTEINHEVGSLYMGYEQERIQFDEIWWYICRRGIPGINAEGSIKRFYFNEGKVVEVDAD